MIWRKQAEGYNAPEEFFQMFGKKMMTLETIKLVAKDWQVWNAAAQSRGMRAQNDLFFTVNAAQIVHEQENPQ